MLKHKQHSQLLELSHRAFTVNQGKVLRLEIQKRGDTGKWNGSGVIYVLRIHFYTKPCLFRLTARLYICRWQT